MTRPGRRRASRQAGSASRRLSAGPAGRLAARAEEEQPGAMRSGDRPAGRSVLKRTRDQSGSGVTPATRCSGGRNELQQVRDQDGERAGDAVYSFIIYLFLFTVIFALIHSDILIYQSRILCNNECQCTMNNINNEINNYTLNYKCKQDLFLKDDKPKQVNLLDSSTDILIDFKQNESNLLDKNNDCLTIPICINIKDEEVERSKTLDKIVLLKLLVNIIKI